MSRHLAAASTSCNRSAALRNTCATPRVRRAWTRLRCPATRNDGCASRDKRLGFRFRTGRGTCSRTSRPNSELRFRMSDSQTVPQLPIAVLISGGGTTLQNLINRIAAGTLPVRIVLVVSTQRNVAGVERAAKAGLPVHVIERRIFPSVEAFSERTFEVCRAAGAQLICLAGYLQLLTIPADDRGKVLNIHPALLPAFGGKGMYGPHVHEAVLKHGAKESGCTVHVVDDHYDHGPIVAQRTVEVKPDDTPEALAKRVFEQECELYPDVIRAFVEGRVSVGSVGVTIRNSV